MSSMNWAYVPWAIAVAVLVAFIVSTVRSKRSKGNIPSQGPDSSRPRRRAGSSRDGEEVD